jgi:hypothetical protein
MSRKWIYRSADIHSMGHFGTVVAPQSVNKLESCVSTLYIPMEFQFTV